MNKIERLYYNVSLRTRNYINKIVERLYYKRFPDRVNEHEIAMAPIPVVKEERGDIVNLKAEIVIPQEMIDKIPREFIRKELSSKLSRMIEPAIEIQEERDRYIGAPVIYTGLIRMIRREVDYFEQLDKA
jgi:hypothetical protein